MIEHFYVSTIPEDPEETRDLMELLPDLLDIERYGTTTISGLTRPKAEISRSALAGANASRISGAKINERNIVLDVFPQGDTEAQRQALYDILPFDTMLRFYIITDSREVFIDGYVETIDGDDTGGELFGVQISIICPFPWFQSVWERGETVRTGYNFVFNRGDMPAGFTFWLEMEYVPESNVPIASTVKDLSISTGGKTFAYTGSVVNPIICTIPGQKTFKQGWFAGGSVADPYPFSKMTEESDWPQIQPGNDVNILIDCHEDSIEFVDERARITWRETYSGI